MNNNTIYIPNKKRIHHRFIHIQVFVLGVLVIYHFIRFFVNPNYELSYASILGYLTVFIWVTLTELSVRKLEFDNEKEELIITKKSFFGKEKSEVVKYTKLKYDAKNFNILSACLFGKKSLIILNNSIELVKLRSAEEFNLEEIEKIEKTIAGIKIYGHI